MAKRHEFFPRNPGDPAPVTASVTHRLMFSEADPMQVAWHGNAPKFFELAYTELVRKCGLFFTDYKAAGILAPIAQFHADYLVPIRPDELITVTASMIWTELPRVNIEYEVRKEDGTLAIRGYTVQLLVQAETGESCWFGAEILDRCRDRWKKGEFQ